MINGLDALGGQELLGELAGMAGGIVHVQEPVSRGRSRVLALENLQEGVEDTAEVLRVD